MAKPKEDVDKDDILESALRHRPARPLSPRESLATFPYSTRHWLQKFVWLRTTTTILKMCCLSQRTNGNSCFWQQTISNRSMLSFSDLELLIKILKENVLEKRDWASNAPYSNFCRPMKNANPCIPILGSLLITWIQIHSRKRWKCLKRRWRQMRNAKLWWTSWIQQNENGWTKWPKISMEQG